MADLSAFPAAEAGNLVWQKVQKALTNASPGAAAVFKGIREYLVQNRRNPDLRFLAFSKADLITANDALGVGIGTAKIYGIYIKKGDDATDAWFTVVDEGTDANIYGGALTASYTVVMPVKIASQEAIFACPTGYDVLVGIRLASFTAGASGTTVSVAAADSVDGFIVYGDA